MNYEELNLEDLEDEIQLKKESIRFIQGLDNLTEFEKNKFLDFFLDEILKIRAIIIQKKQQK
jgi:hypothetical protein